MGGKIAEEMINDFNVGVGTVSDRACVPLSNQAEAGLKNPFFFTCGRPDCLVLIKVMALMAGVAVKGSEPAYLA